jgi:hypothetical protein
VVTPRCPELVPAGFFAIRAPVLPFSVLEKWADGVESSDDPDP